jgi:hypothetical protein
MNTWQLKIEFCVHTCPPDCACPIRKGPCWPKSASDSGAKLWPKSPPWPSPIPFWVGIAKLIAYKFDGSKYRRYPSRPRIEPKLEALIVQMAKENSGWGYDRIVGALANLGYKISGQTVGNVLKRNGIAPTPKRSQTTTWKEFIQSHMAVLAGIDFFTVEVLTWRGLVTYYILFFIHLESRRVSLAGITRHNDQA